MAEPRIEKTTSATDDILEYATQYAQDGSYPPALTKDKKRAVRKRAALLTVDKGEVFFNRGKMKVKVVVSCEEQLRILKTLTQVFYRCNSCSSIIVQISKKSGESYTFVWEN